MMRYLWLSTLLLVTAWAVPPVPDVGHGIKKQQVLKECKVPAQIVVLPPMVEPDYRECANRYYEPDHRDIAYGLSQMLGREVQVQSVRVAPGFLRAYEVVIAPKTPDAPKLTFVCSEKVESCYQTSQLYVKPEKKDKK